MNEYIPFVVVVRPIEGELEVPVLVVLVNHQWATNPRNTWCFTSNSFERDMVEYYVCGSGKVQGRVQCEQCEHLCSVNARGCECFGAGAAGTVVLYHHYYVPFIHLDPPNPLNPRSQSASTNHHHPAGLSANS
jgi:hypothetical protein